MMNSIEKTNKQLQETMTALDTNSVSTDIVDALQGYSTAVSRATDSVTSYVGVFTGDSSFLIVGVGAFVAIMILRLIELNGRFYRYG